MNTSNTHCKRKYKYKVWYTTKRNNYIGMQKVIPVQAMEALRVAGG
jgi:hypothetical protein